MLMFNSYLLTLAMAGAVAATLSPASSNSKGKCPSSPPCAAAKTSRNIQAAECSHNTRTHGTQTFAIFTVDHSLDKNHGAPYGTCSAYTCEAPPSSSLAANQDCWTFYWGSGGESSGEGAGCIKDPNDGTCGCENSNGQFVKGSSGCK